ncbi:MAG: CRISPR-associated endonuclease Cas2 [Burkholderiaceae bacterium]|nr:CRISPR-associated endonuclease Cas2 [Burkholderiaceae bacterium]
MNANAPTTWLVAYDISSPKRLREVHRYVKRRGSTVQYSVFSVVAGTAGIETMLDEIASLIYEREDDVRAYHVPASCQVWSLGRQGLPAGVMLDADCVTRLLISGRELERDT